MYNASRFVGETLASVLAQTLSDIEVLVVDDGSTDDSVAVVQRLADTVNSPIRLLRQANGGPSRARNAALAVAQGEFVALLDADDLWMPTYLERTVSFLDSHAGLSLVFTDSILFGEGERVGKRWIALHPSKRPFTTDRIIGRSCNVPSNNVFRRSIIASSGVFDETLRAAEDWDLWIRMSLAGAKIDYLAEPLHRYRQHASSISASDERLGHGILAVCEKLAADKRVGPAARASLQAQQRLAREIIARSVARHCFRARDYRGSRRALAEAQAHKPNVPRAISLLGLWLAPGLMRSAARWGHFDPVR